MTLSPGLIRRHMDPPAPAQPAGTERAKGAFRRALLSIDPSLELPM